ncbi:helix-turn-helix domain-containing protein [Clostridium sp. DSM 100503]|uniref:helix-turn-helix domain-containing protein n=1 Tax=Clostridium sp. DSM 100503 TaxID=2963282 RepID=UPI00214A6006|nr:S24 family peptidase [Clostridium sp. DSM 100503]MCR1952742.1 helix-turn-helix domain-containing protein [Clostridium sp. DSM 100503]
MYLINFPEKLKRIRLSNDLTQSELANILHTTKQAISSYESGKSMPSLNALIRLSEHFNISLDSLVFDNNTNNLIRLSNNTDYAMTLELLNIKSKIDNILNELSKPENYKNEPSTNFNEEFSDEQTPEIIDLDEYKKSKNNIKCRMIPISGNVSAGDPCYTEEDLIDIIPIPENLLYSSSEYYILYIKGDSMNELFENGELVLVEYTHCISTNDIAIVLVATDETTVKKVKLYEDCITLIPMSTNPIHKPRTLNLKDVCIQGKVVGKLFDILKPSL